MTELDRLPDIEKFKAMAVNALKIRTVIIIAIDKICFPKKNRKKRQLINHDIDNTE